MYLENHYRAARRVVRFPYESPICRRAISPCSLGDILPQWRQIYQPLGVLRPYHGIQRGRTKYQGLFYNFQTLSVGGRAPAHIGETAFRIQKTQARICDPNRPDATEKKNCYEVLTKKAYRLSTFIKYNCTSPSSIVSIRHVSLNELTPCGIIDTNSVPGDNSGAFLLALTIESGQAFRPSYLSVPARTFSSRSSD